jgi:DNA primase large subunit
MSVEALRKSPMMMHLLDALDAGQDIGHYGKLTFAMIARHFLNEDELISYLQKSPDCSETEAKALFQQVQGKDYNPPKRDRILEWQQQQDFPICPDANDPDACNVYKELEFPEHVYEHISSYYEQKAEA